MPSLKQFMKEALDSTCKLPPNVLEHTDSESRLFSHVLSSLSLTWLKHEPAKASSLSHDDILKVAKGLGTTSISTSNELVLLEEVSTQQ